VGPGYTDINQFLRAVDFSAFNLQEKRPALVRRIKALQPEASNRAIGQAVGVSDMTVGRDLTAATNVAPEPQPAADAEAIPDEAATNVAPAPAAWFQHDGADVAQQVHVATTQAQARQRQPAPVNGPVPWPAGRYRCLVLDPPWPMAKSERTARPRQGVALAYPVMSLEAIGVNRSTVDRDMSGGANAPTTIESSPGDEHTSGANAPHLRQMPQMAMRRSAFPQTWLNSLRHMPHLISSTAPPRAISVTKP
jgi:hypothetical protein